ncbi:MAG: hypothetical protein WCF84_27355 [Anaerolineae bacterium]
MSSQEPDAITIIEGPPPQFKDADQVWTLSLVEANQPYDVSLTQVRSFKGQALLDRCRRAWGAQRPIYFDFPTYSGLRRRFEIIAAKFEQLPEGDLLNLWVRHRPNETQDVAPRGDEP